MMLRTALVAGPAAGLIAGCVAIAPAAPPAPLPAEVRLVSAIEAEGCVLNSGNVASVLLRANLTQAELGEIMPVLEGAGRVEVAGDNAIRVLTERCI